MSTLFDSEIPREFNETHLGVDVLWCFQRGLIKEGKLTLNVGGAIPWASRLNPKGDVEKAN